MTQGRTNRLVGIATELVICADLLRKGWVPFRSIDHFGPYDLLVDDGARLWKIEVKTGGANGRPHFGSGLHKSNYPATGKRSCYPGGPQGNWPTDPKFDVCAVLQRDGTIEYYNRRRVRIWTHDFPVVTDVEEVVG